MILLAHDTQSEGMFAKLCVGTMTSEISSRDQSFQARLSTSCFKQALDKHFERNLSHHPHSIYVSTALKIFSMLSSGMCSQSSSMCMSVHYTSSKCISFFECCKEDHNISQHSKSLRPWLKCSKVSISKCTFATPSLGGNQVWIVIVTYRDALWSAAQSGCVRIK